MLNCMWYKSTCALLNCIFTICYSSCRKVMFLQTSVILSTGGCAWQGACIAGCMHGKGAMCGRGGSVHGRGTCMVEGVCMARAGGAWQGAFMAWRACVAGEMATAIDGVHPTGMHSCYRICFCKETNLPYNLTTWIVHICESNQLWETQYFCWECIIPLILELIWPIAGFLHYLLNYTQEHFKVMKS